ncbi:MAG: SH3-like domain-containing protein [Pseudomonadota bacterium]
MTARFQIGDRVKVAERSPPGHLRTPFYCRGKTGTVVKHCGAFPNPEALAYGNYAAERVDLYRVGFAQQTLWDDYAGSDADRVEIEIYDHWLEPSP